MSFVKIWIHAVWAVKNRKPVLNQDIRKSVFEHIHKNALEKEIFMDTVGGHHNHIHCLFRLKNSQSIDNIMQLIKGESSFWFNHSELSGLKLNWQKEYFAVSVSESNVAKVRNYILNQDEHHKRKHRKKNIVSLSQNMAFRLLKAKAEEYCN